MKTVILFLSTFLGLFVSIYTLVGQASTYYSDGYKIEHYNHKDGPPGNDIGDLFQDKNGNLWLVNGESLVKYDGYKFKTYTPPSDTAIAGLQKYLWKLEEDKDGFIWASTLGGGFLRFNPAIEEFKRFITIGTKSLAKELIPNFDILDSTRILTGGVGKIFQINLEQQTLSQKEISNVTEDVAGSLAWVFKVSEESIWVAGKHRLDQLINWGDSLGTGSTAFKSYIHLIQPDSTIETTILYVAKSSRGGIWVSYAEKKEGTILKEGIGLLNPTTNTFQRLNLKNDPLNIHLLQEGIHGDLWAGTLGNGVYIIPQPFHFEDSPAINRPVAVPLLKDKKPNEFIRSLLIDRLGNLWVGTMANRLFKVDLNGSNKIKYLELPIDSLNNESNITGLMEDKSGNIWAGLIRGGILKSDANLSSSDYYEMQKSNGYFTTPLKQIGNTLWFSGRNSIVSKNIKTDRFNIFTLPDSIAIKNGLFLDLIEGEKDTLWLLYGNGQILQFHTKKKQFYFYHGHKEYIGESILLLEKHQGELYYGDALGRIGKVKELKAKDKGLLLDTHVALLDFIFSKNGDMWITTFSGLSKWSPTTKKVKNYFENSPQRYASLIEDPTEKIWLFSEYGVKQFDPTVETFSSFHDLSNVDLPSNIGKRDFVSRENKIIFLGRKGIYAFDPARIKKDSITPNLSLSNFWINNTEIKDIDKDQAVKFSLGNPLSLTYDNNDLDIQYTGIDYRNRKTTYTYQLEGYQDNWQEVGTERIARYPNLPPGDYTFKVKAANADGIWSQPKSIDITIRPPWWQTWWAKILYALAAIGILAYWARSMQQKVKRKEVQLQKEQQHNEELKSLNQELTTTNEANQRFVPKDFLSILGKESIKDLQLGDQRSVNMTILFSDIRSYTTLSETMSPEDNFKFINGYLGRVGPIIKAHDGFISQYYGDGLMALFLDNHAGAIEAAIAIQQALHEYNQERKAKDRQAIKTGMGLNTGSLMLGVIGDEHRYDSTVISDAVNTASRMEGLTKTFGASVIMSEKTLAAIHVSDTSKVSDTLSHRFLGKVKVKGKDIALDIYEVYAGDAPHIRQLKQQTQALFEQGIHHYFDRQFGKAAECFKQVLEQHKEDKAAQYYLNKAVKFIIDGVGEAWNGVEEMVAK